MQYYFDPLFEKCESEIEKLFLESWLGISGEEYNDFNFDCDFKLNKVSRDYYDDCLSFERIFYEIRPQYKVDNYRVDFLIRAFDLDKNQDLIYSKILVECDGYEFHKSHEKFIHDRQRDRFLKCKGFDVVRASGSEICNEPELVIDDCLNILRMNLAEKPELITYHPSNAVFKQKNFYWV